MQGENLSFMWGHSWGHTHDPVVGRPEALKVRVDMKDRAVSILETPQQVISQHMTTVTEGIYIYIYIYPNIVDK